MKRALLFFVVAFAGAGLVLACSSPEKYIGGGRNFEPGAPIEVDGSATPPDADLDQSAQPDVFVPPDTGPKDASPG